MAPRKQKQSKNTHFHFFTAEKWSKTPFCNSSEKKNGQKQLSAVHPEKFLDKFVFFF